MHRLAHRSGFFCCSVPEIAASHRGRGNPIAGICVCYRGTAGRDMFRPIRQASSGEFSMTITTAHIPAIVALIAGILILLMPRLLNLVVAIYLIFIGLVGIGVLKMFHLG
jgi:hypothetical protein